MISKQFKVKTRFIKPKAVLLCFKSACALLSNQSSANVIEKDLGLDRIHRNLHLLLFGMYFLPDLMLRLLVEEVMRSVSAAEAEEGTIMD